MSEERVKSVSFPPKSEKRVKGVTFTLEVRQPTSVFMLT